MTGLPGYDEHCKSCNSEHRAEIEHLAKVDKKSPRWISKYLLDTYGEEISHHGIRNHLKVHFDIKSSIWDQYEQSRGVMAQATELAVEDIKIIDSVVADEFNLHRLLGTWLNHFLKFDPANPPREIPKIPMAVTTLYEACSAEIMRGLKLKMEMLGEDPASNSGAAAQTWAELVDLAGDFD